RAVATDQRATLEAHGRGAGILRLDRRLQGVHGCRDLDRPAEQVAHKVDLVNQLRHDRAASRRAPASPPVGPHLAGLAGLRWRLEARTAAETAEHQTPESSWSRSQSVRCTSGK